jgi:hypothetical protein
MITPSAIKRPTAGDALDATRIGGAAGAISTLAWTHGITVEPAPIDAFTDAAARLSDAEVTFDRTECLLLGLARADLITDEQRFALHAAYLLQKADDVRPVRRPRHPACPRAKAPRTR